NPYSLGADGANWDPLIDELEIYSRVLSTDEIVAKYAAGAGRFYDFNTV
ncbi:unnamed protein product, partial [marine sediment metagenome]